MKIYSKVLLMLSMVTFGMSALAEDVSTEVALACKAKGFTTTTLINCPEYHELIKHLQSVAGSAVNDPKIKAENKAAMDASVDTAGVNKNN